MESLTLSELESLIKEKQEELQKAMDNNAELSLLTYMKKDIDYFRERHLELFKKNK